MRLGARRPGWGRGCVWGRASSCASLVPWACLFCVGKTHALKATMFPFLKSRSGGMK